MTLIRSFYTQVNILGRHLMVLSALTALSISSLPYPSVLAAEEVIFFDDFKGVSTKLPSGEYKIYPDPSIWAFTLWPGKQWPDSYGVGTNWLPEESQVYLSPWAKKTHYSEKSIAPNLRYDPFHISEQGLHITANVLTTEQQKAYKVGGHRRFGSGIILSRTAFKYGRVRVIAKLPSARGTWPALWLLPVNNQWPPEIDPFEAMAWGKHATQIHSGMMPRDEEQEKYPKNGRWFDLETNPSQEFHEYGLDWDEQNITATFDGKVLWESKTPPSMKQEMYLIINLAVGGHWAYNELGILPIDSKEPERLDRGADEIEKDYPAQMIIKSVKVTRTSAKE